jgi:GNAT superfamily N-acetyltransferase
MELRSLQIRTDLMLRAWAGQILERRGYIVVRTPHNPTFRWGNYLVFTGPPAPGDLRRWTAIFAREVGVPPAVAHQAFTWDAPDAARGAVDEFADAGFDVWETTAMSARELAAPLRHPTPCRIRDFADERDWDAWVELLVAQNRAATAGEREEPEGHRVFATRMAGDWRRMVGRGWGRWFGAWVGDMLVSSMGLFVRDGLGRFQSVDTHPDHRGRGYASTLLRQVAAEGLTAMGAHTLVIVADLEGPASRIYRAAGFRPTERIVEIERVDWTKTASGRADRADYSPPVQGLARSDMSRAPRRRRHAAYEPLRSFTSAVSCGTIVCRSPTTPKSLKSKIGALASLLIATITWELCMPTLCWIAPLTPQPM